MNPPSSVLSAWAISFNRLRSSSLSIRREIPICLLPRHKDHVAAGSDTWEVTRAPFGAERVFGDLDENFFAPSKLFFERQPA